ncbi:MAG: hypothetical protein CSA81_06930 [Acidobacteria bacterium]|nr:MAG: hypothetical protein CSA81_06930 [Acidobacteriota bacterium]
MSKPIVIPMLCFLAASISGNTSKTVTLSAGVTYQLNIPFTEIEFPENDRSLIAISKARKTLAFIAVTNLPEKSTMKEHLQSVIVRVFNNASQLSFDSQTESTDILFQLAQKDRSIEFQSHYFIKQNFVFILIAPQQVFQTLLTDFRSSFRFNEVKRPASEADEFFTWWQVTITITIFIAFILFILKALGASAKVASKES